MEERTHKQANRRRSGNAEGHRSFSRVRKREWKMNALNEEVMAVLYENKPSKDFRGKKERVMKGKSEERNKVRLGWIKGRKEKIDVRKRKGGKSIACLIAAKCTVQWPTDKLSGRTRPWGKQCKRRLDRPITSIPHTLCVPHLLRIHGIRGDQKVVLIFTWNFLWLQLLYDKMQLPFLLLMHYMHSVVDLSSQHNPPLFLPVSDHCIQYLVLVFFRLYSTSSDYLIHVTSVFLFPCSPFMLSFFRDSSFQHVHTIFIWAILSILQCLSTVIHTASLYLSFSPAVSFIYGTLDFSDNLLIEFY